MSTDEVFVTIVKGQFWNAGGGECDAARLG